MKYQGIRRLITYHSAQYFLWLVSWGVLGSLTFSGHFDRGWLIAWALLLVTLLPFRLLTTWSQGLLALRWGAAVKRKLLLGALSLDPQVVRTQGIGTFLGQALEAEEIENLAVSGGMGGMLALLELLPAIWVLGRVGIALIVWCALAFLAGWRFFGSYRQWTAQRTQLSGTLIESMAGYRTRLLQQYNHASEDRQLAEYLTISQRLDAAGSWLIALIPRGWLLFGLAMIAPSLTAREVISSRNAVLLGGVLLAYSAFQRLTAAFADAAGALAGWRRIQPLLAAVHLDGGTAAREAATNQNRCLIDAERLTFQYPGQVSPVLRECSLKIDCGDRILLRGSSGGGKTTLGLMLAGMLRPQSGLLLLNGLDRHTLGEAGWRKQVAAAPQFHDNHMLTGPLALNLLMGRAWPPQPGHLAEAEKVCRELGLGALLDNMPNGLMQMVGEGGWQLSHGERSRIFLARALLQPAKLVILDESFAALDPENLQAAMQTTLRRAPSLLVIAHP